MAMIKCPDCGSNVSDRAQTCPKCGFPIQEEVQRLKNCEATTEDMDSAYADLNELDTAKKYVIAALNKDYSTMNGARRALESKYTSGKYCSILKESVVFSDDEKEQETFILKNFQLLTDYLDYPMLETGYRDWIDLDDEEKKYKGFFQTTPEVYEDFTNYYVVESVYEIIAMNSYSGVVPFSGYIRRRFKLSSGYGYIIVLKENKTSWENLAKKNKEFYAHNLGSIWIDNHGIKENLHKGDLVWLNSEQIEKTVIDQGEIDRQILHAVGQMLTLGPNVSSSPMKTSTSAVVGTAVAGLPGALIGYAIGKERNNNYANAIERSRQVEQEREEARRTMDELKRGNKPTKQVKITRNYYGIRTYAGIYPIYFDNEKVVDENITIDGQSIHYYDWIENKIGYKKDITFRNLQANIFLSRGELISEKYAIDVIDKLGIEDTDTSIAQRYYDFHKNDNLENVSSVDEIEKWIHIYEDLGNFIDTSKEIKKCKDAIYEYEYLEIIRKIKNATTVKEFENVIEQLKRFVGYKEAERKIQDCKDSINEIRYKEAILRQESSSNDLEYNDVAQLFDTLGDYKDSELRASDCREAANKLQKRTQKRIRTIISAIIGIIVIVLAIVFILKVVIPNSQYKSAMNFKNQGDYESAIQTFSQISEYKDSSYQMAICEDEIKEIAYQEAMNLMEGGKYDDAIEIFNSLSGYKSSLNNIRACQLQKEYNEALALMNDGKYDDAISKFTDLDDYEDSKEKIIACQAYLDLDDYNTARNLMKEEKYKEAIDLFYSIYEYEDSSELITESEINFIKNARVGDVVYFGNYSEGDISSREWIVIVEDNNRKLLLSKYTLGWKRFDEIPANVSSKKTTWENCTLRTWLNDSYYNNSFNDSEKEIIQTSVILTPDNTYFPADGGKDTKDKVFLLSIDEALTYLSTKKDRIAESTEGYNKTWWLRTPSTNNEYIAYVNMEGQVNVEGDSVLYGSCDVRPVLWVDLQE